MLPILKKPVAMSVFLLFCAMPICAQSQRSSSTKGINSVSAPVPAPLLIGKRAFISYELGDVTAFPSSYSGGPERAYSELFEQMKAWGRYELVMDPKDADVVFAVRFVDSPGLPRPQIRVGISDAKTHVTLWGFVEEVNFAFFKKHRDDAFSATVQLLVADIQALVTPDATPVTAKPSGKTRLSDEAR
jgi:hypothetical protein